MNFKKFTVSLATMVTLLAPVSVFAQDAIKIGGNFELSGPAASYGSMMSKATQLAIKQANDNKMLDSTVEYVEFDNKSDLTEATSVANRLASEDVVGVVGPATSGDVKAQMSVLDEAKVPSLAPAATLDGLTMKDNGDVFNYFYRVSFEDSYQGKAAAAYAVDTLGAKKVVVVTDQANDYSLGLADAFKGAFQEKGGQVASEASFQTGDTDFSAVLTTLVGQDFDVLYVPVYYTEAGLFIKQAREMGITQPIVGGDGYHSDILVELAGAENANDVYYTSHFSTKSDDEKVKAFIDTYKAEYNEEPDTFAALAYDATNVMLDAVKRAGSTDKKAVNKALAETKDFPGITGTFTIDENHNPVKTATMIKLTSGEVESAEEVTAE